MTVVTVPVEEGMPGPSRRSRFLISGFVLPGGDYAWMGTGCQEENRFWGHCPVRYGRKSRRAEVLAPGVWEAMAEASGGRTHR